MSKHDSAITRLVVCSLALAGCFGSLCPRGDKCIAGSIQCDGDVVMVCEEQHNDTCPYTEYVARADCDTSGADCASGTCVSRTEVCPEDAKSICLDGKQHRCFDGRPEIVGNVCKSKLTCFDVIDDISVQRAVCALSITPCFTVLNESSECRGGQVVSCLDGYPVSVVSCRSDQTCIERRDRVQSGECGPHLDLSCPDDSQRVCAVDVVLGCELGTPSPVVMRDCRLDKDRCDASDAEVICRADDARRLPTRWQAVRGGTFNMGPVGLTHEVTVADFEMTQTEVSVSAYNDCVRAGVCSPRSTTSACAPWLRGARPDLKAELPVLCIGFEQAQAFCTWFGGRLPTSAEWEYALRNQGRDIDPRPPSDAGKKRLEPQPGCATLADVTEQGICDMVGNVQEWVEDETSITGARARGSDFAPSEEVRTLRGGGSTVRDPFNLGGMRCAR